MEEKLSFNDRIALFITKRFGTMVMMYLFMVYGIMGAIFVDHQASLLYWSNWVQLWSLPLLLVGTNLLGRAAEKREQKMSQQIDDLYQSLHAKLDDHHEELKAHYEK